jgi:hypothetical protein
MAVNVTEKDKTLNEIIYFCEEVMSVWCRLEGARARGYREALADVIAHCHDSLGIQTGCAQSATKGEMCGLTQVTTD